jgi:acetyltransferase-like isoleucine patch superfamily enzyme
MINKIKRALFHKLVAANRDLLEDYFSNYLLCQPKFYGSRDKIFISEKSNVNNGLFNSASGTITIKDFAFFGHNVSVIAASHDITKFGEDRMRAIPTEGLDIVVEEGAWIGSNSIIIGPCRIGKNAVVAAGSVVIKDVGEYEVVGGVPAKFLKKIN